MDRLDLRHPETDDRSRKFHHMFILRDILTSAWIPVFLCIALTLHFRWRSGSWFAPSAFLGLVWSVSLTASLFGVDHRVPALGFWLLVTLVAVIQLGSALSEPGSTETEKQRIEGSRLANCWPQRSRIGSLVITLIALLGLVHFMFSSLNQYDLPFELGALVQLGARATLLRYSGDIGGWSERLVAIWLYPAALLGGILFSLSERIRDKFIGLSSLLPALLYSFLAGARSPLLVGLACWLGGMWAVRQARAPSAMRSFNLRTVLSLLGLAACLLFVFIAIDTFRGHVDIQELHFESDYARLRNYMLGSPAAFADWVQHPDDSSLRFGALTFEGLYNLLGIRQRELGTYTDAAQTVGQESTNIFTVFRGLIQDFTLLGAFLVCGLWGFASGRAYSKRSLRWSPTFGLSSFYALALFSPLYCLFIFNGPIFGWIVAWLVLRQRSVIASHPATSMPNCAVEAGSS
jgi:oligosaccharide repeat unit polymerase